MVLWTSAFLLGVLTPTTWSWVPDGWVIVIWLVFALIVGGLCPALYKNYGKIVVAFLFGVVWCSYRVSNLQLHLPSEILNQPIIALGKVVSFPEHQGNRVRFIYLIEKINHKPCKRKIRIFLSEYSYNSAFLLSVQRGDYWQLPIRLKKPGGWWNTYGFDQQSFLLQQGIVATGTLIKSSQAISAIKKIRSTKQFMIPYQVANYIYHWRIKLSDYIYHNSFYPNYRGLVQALVVGKRQEIPSHQWEVMRATGTNHLFSISGLHVGLVGGSIYSMVRFLWSQVSLLCLWMPAREAASVGGWLGALVYSMLSGFALPIQRAIIMLSIFSLSVLRRQIVSPWKGWCIALLLTLFINPLVVLSESFWLSFGAVAMIFYGLAGRLKLREAIPLYQKLWIGSGKTQWIVTIGLTPATLWFFQQLSIVSMLANLIAIPYIGFIVLPLSLLGTLSYSLFPIDMNILFIISQKSLDYLWQLLSYLATLPISHYFIVIPNVWILLNTTLSALLLIAPVGFPSRHYLSMIGMLPLLLWKSPCPPSNAFWLTVLDVGQGLAAVIRTHQHVLVYDTGPRFGNGLDAGNMALLPYLRSIGIRKIDTLVISHGDSDHSGGMKSTLKAMPVQSVLTSELARVNAKNACHCQSGQHWEWDGVKFSMLHPLGGAKLRPNDSSCVLKVSNDHYQLLLPGDIHRKGEKIMLTNHPNLSHITLLIAPHHGSKTSSSKALIERICPQYVIFPVGYQNRFRFPHQEVVDRYRHYHTQLYSTATEGMITVKFNSFNPGLTIESFYQHNRRFWHQRPL